MQFSEFANDRYKVLAMLYSRQMPYKKEKYASLTQQELADLCCFSKVKCTGIVKWLIDNGFVVNFDNKKNKYQLTEKGKLVIKQMKKEF